ncbi:PPK2 family polyphosphate kinase [Hutsoniella sourekii]|uniref:PPK2 family polyphosphate kinase n=1 Tax=Hutsoniella sourekii TaxID=87650 RepID=UPI0004847877|nr:PPK2 family polyphosphate kinase [Hutsoniella sourekii]
MDLKRFMVEPGQAINLAQRQTKWEASPFQSSQEVLEAIDTNMEEIKELQQKLMAQETEALIFALQALDAAGKDEAERYLFSQLSSQGLRTTAMKKPTSEDLKHDYLWRLGPAMPERGEIAVFNRSHYEEVIGARMHQSYQDQNLPDQAVGGHMWQQRFKHINHFEDYLYDNGFYMIKIYLHISKEVQKDRLLQRMEDPDHLWEFSMSDLDDRAKWDEYMDYFQETFSQTSTERAPWYIIPADDGDLGRYIISEILLDKLRSLDLSYPEVSSEYKQEIQEAADKLRQGDYD